MNDRIAPGHDRPLRRPSALPTLDELEDTQQLLPEPYVPAPDPRPRPAPPPPRPRPPRPAASSAGTPAIPDGAAPERRRLSPWVLGGMVAGALAAIALWIGLAATSSGDLEFATSDQAGRAAKPAAAEASQAVSDLGGPIALSPDGTLSGLDGVGPNVQRAVAESLRTGTLPDYPELSQLRAPQPQVSPPAAAPAAASGSPPPSPTPAVPPEAPRLVAPVGVRLLGDRPRFSWNEVPGAAGYEVAVVDRHGNEVVASPHLRLPYWEPPRPLPRGRMLIWRVTTQVRRGELAPPISEGRFALVSVEELAWLEREIAAARDSRLVAAVLYAEVGALDDCHAPLVELARANPRAAVVGRLLADLLQKKGR